MGWSARIPAAQAYARAGGRRRYNAQRQRARDARRAQIAALVLASERPCVAPLKWGWARDLSRLFGVDASTISRDLRAIYRTIVLPVPCCRLHAEDEERERERNRLGSAGFGRTLGRILGPAGVARVMRSRA